MLNVNTSDNKNLALILYADTSGCSHYRLRWNALYYAGHEHLGFVPVLMPFPIFDGSYLCRAKAIIIQRPINEKHIELVKRYKALQAKYGYKLVFELDDQVFTIDGQKLPDYNTSSIGFDTDVVTKRLREIFPLFDEIVVSTDYLKMKIEEVFDVHNVTVIRNVVPRFLWSYPRKEPLSEDIKKPTILYSGSPCHYRNPVMPRGPSPQEPHGFPGITPMKGDLDNAWCDWIIKNVREDKINFVVMGSLPWFWNCIKDKIKVIPWVDCNSFPRQVLETKADFSIAPLVNNTFNKCKSSLRMLESCAAGQVFIGSIFRNENTSPYEEAHPDCKVYDDATIEQIDAMFWPLCKKEKFNEIRDWQYAFINTNGYWLESDKHANQWMSMIDNGVVYKPNLI